MTTFNDARLRKANDKPVNPTGKYVLYWCQMARRLRANHALDAALNWCKTLKKPLVVFEAVKLNYPWASARFHRFMLEGMRDNAAVAAKLGITYWPFVATADHSGRGLMRQLCRDACLVVTDDFPQFIVPAHIRAVASKVEVSVHAIDGNSMVPLARLGPAVAAAAHLRPRIHKLFAEAWTHRAATQPDIPTPARAVVNPPFAPWRPLCDLDAFVKSLPIDHTVPAVPDAVGGSCAGAKVLATFVAEKLPQYADGRNQPDDPAANAASRLSPYLHYGHVGIQDVCEAVLGKAWTPSEINPKTRNKDDFFCRDANVNGFLDEAITWRDVGYQWHFARGREQSAGGCVSTHDPKPGAPSFNFNMTDFSTLPSAGTLAGVLPPWALETLRTHAKDKRPHTYTLDEFEHADTHDELWNAAQRELVATGRIHNYLRMLWGKKVLEWSPTPEAAYRVLEHLNNKYALDGRDPNSYTGILWCFGLFDRPWPGDRAVFGSVRYMSSDSTAKKFKLAGYYDYVRRLPSVADVRAGKSVAVRPGGLF